jgi:hypothetical protein
MRKPPRVTRPKLVIRRETIRDLEQRELERVVGGETGGATCTTGMQQLKPPAG